MRSLVEGAQYGSVTTLVQQIITIKARNSVVMSSTLKPMYFQEHFETNSRV